MGKAIKMGASSLKVKPFRLFFTILLATAAFVLFGVALVVAFLGTFFPVFRISRRKPVDSMRSM